jgi:hypothetical protein
LVQIYKKCSRGGGGGVKNVEKLGKFTFFVNLFFKHFLLRKKLWGGGVAKIFKIWPKFTKNVGGEGVKFEKSASIYKKCRGEGVKSEKSQIKTYFQCEV